MTSRWGDEKTIHFIRLYRTYECLWNPSSPLYTNKSARDQAYLRIQEDMNAHNVPMTVSNIKNKVKGLRSTYHQELAKIKKADLYTPNLVWFNEIDFLNDVIEYRKSKCTESTLQACAETLEHQQSRASTEANTEDLEPLQTPASILEIKIEPIEQTTESSTELNIEPQSPPHQNATEILAQSDLSQSNEQPRSNNSNKRRIVTKKQTIQNKKRKERNETSIQENVSTANSGPNVTLKDEFYYFGQSVAAQLRMLPLDNALDMQTKIQMLLSAERSRLHHSISYDSTSHCQTLLENSSNITPYSDRDHYETSPPDYPISSDPLDSASTSQTKPKAEPAYSDDANVE